MWSQVATPPRRHSRFRDTLLAPSRAAVIPSPIMSSDFSIAAVERIAAPVHPAPFASRDCRSVSRCRGGRNCVEHLNHYSSHYRCGREFEQD
jgi:hypothetical protein